MSSRSTVVVTITGAAGRIAYSLIPLVCDGSLFGPHTFVRLRLLDIPMAESKLQGLLMEIEDSSFELLQEVIATVDPQEAFSGCEVAILLGGFPRSQGMERRDLIERNADGMREQARAINAFAHSDCRILVVANPANTNCWVAMESAPRIPRKNFSSLSRLDHERLRGFIARDCSSLYGQYFSTRDIRNVAIFGNHSATQVPFFNHCYIHDGDRNFDWKPDAEKVESLRKSVQIRGAEVIRQQGAGSALSAARAIVMHLQDWLGVGDCSEVESFSMGVLSDGNTYGVPEGLIFSFPCRRRYSQNQGALFCDYEIVNDLDVDEKSKELIQLTTSELEEEKKEAMNYLQGLPSKL